MMLNINQLVEKCHDALPPEVKRHPWIILNHGCDVLDSEEKLNAYISSYGEMHIKKCRKAFQNFPFDDFCHKNEQGETLYVKNFEIFDWGCGQGIGTLTLLQFLEDRNMLHSLQRVNLIEPSEFAIRRAYDWIRQSVNAHTEVRTYNRFIPSNDALEWEDIDCKTTLAIHIFSNILDIRSVGLAWLAEITSKLSSCSYYVCVGPKYGKGISRITDFYNYMGAPVCFTDFATYPFEYTTKTNHPFGIEVKGFKFSETSNIDHVYSEQSLQQHRDEYDMDFDALKGLLPDSIFDVYRILKEQVSKSFEIYLRPNVGIERPDFILTNISRGIIIVNVCDDISDFDKAFDKVEAIKQSLFDTYVKNLKIGTILNSPLYNCIKTAIFFSSAITEENEVDEKYSDLINAVKPSDDQNIPNNKRKSNDPSYFLLKLHKKNVKSILSSVTANGFKFDYYKEIKDLFLAQWHSSIEGNVNIKLTGQQKKYFYDESKRLRIKGVAGSGKTQLIAFKAVRENIRTGSRVLIITYNISLINYVRMKLNVVPYDFSLGDIDIINYHQFFWSKARRYHGRRIPLSASDDATFFEPYKNEIVKNKDQYQTIIVDEAQDYMTAWFDCLRNYFLTPDGTMILFGDGEQNIFKRDQAPDIKMPIVNGFGGSGNPWRPMNERISMRMQNPQIAQLASCFANAFHLSSQPINSTGTLNLYDYKIRYWKKDPVANPEILAKNLIWIISNYTLDKKDVVVLSQNIGLLRETDKYYRDMTNSTTIRTFESEEEYQNIKTKNTKLASLVLDLKAIRRVAKVHFTTQSENLKFATIASFKGWESKVIILLLQNTDLSSQGAKEEDNQFDIGLDDASLIYTAITRAKQNLFIINIGNNTYHSFFQNNIRND